jgi:hypothetical protein
LRRRLLALAAAGLLAANQARAEPAIAVRTGYRCSQCHVNVSGGGMRTPFGSLYTQLVMPASTFRWRDEGNLLPANPDARFAVGSDLRARYLESRSDELPDSSTAEVSNANLYLLGRLLPGRLSVYLDETVAPGGASAREAFGLFSFAQSKWRGHVKAGKFLPAYGWRLPDDAAFIRQNTGFSYESPDTGIEAGIEPSRWSLVAALTNGAGGDVDDDRSKRSTLQVVRRFRDWRLGVHGSRNNRSGTKTEQAGALAGAGFGVPLPFVQLRWFARSGDGPPQVAGSRDSSVELELHLFF